MTIPRIAALLILLTWPLTLDIPLLDPDEGLHAAIAQEMVERGDWLTPTFLGEPFLDKPVLFFWTQMVSLRTVGMSEAGVRLPGLLFGLLGAIATGLLARELYGHSAGLVAAAIQATMIGLFAQSQAGVHDIALVPWTTLSLLFLLRADRAAGRSAVARALAAASVFLGLAILTKGLAGVALVVVAVASVLIVTRRLTIARLVCVGACVAAGLTIAAAWYLPMEQAHPGYLHYYFIDRHLRGYATGNMRHSGKPWWYYLPVLFGVGFPWCIYVVVAARDWWREKRDANSAESVSSTTMVWVWLCSGLIFLTLSHVKLWTYALPLFPAIAILAARVWTNEIDAGADRSHRLFRWAVTLHIVLGALLLPVAWMYGETTYGIGAPAAIASVCILVVAAAYCWTQAAFVRGARKPVLISMVSLLATTGMIALCLLMPSAANAMSERDLALHFNRLGAMPPHLLVVDDRVGSLVFYLTPEIRHELTPARVASVPMPFARAEIGAASPDTVIAVRERRASQFAQVTGFAAIPYDRAGQFRLYLARTLQYDSRH